jgi:uncharacterized OB-fold protein
MTLLHQDPQAPQAWQGDLPVMNRYTYGLAGERFFRTIKEEAKIMGTHCPNCDRTYVPAAAFCERCLGKLDEWVDVGTIGDIVTYTFLNVGLDGTPLAKPEIGLLVEAVFLPKSKRVGSILDIKYFKPA